MSDAIVLGHLDSKIILHFIVPSIGFIRDVNVEFTDANLRRTNVGAYAIKLQLDLRLLRRVCQERGTLPSWNHPGGPVESLHRMYAAV